MGTIHPDITRPADLAVGTAPSELLDSWHRHISALVNARHGIGDPLPAERIAHRALDALAVGQALAETVTRSRWITVVDALAHGAQLGHVATAMGLEVDEVAVGLRMWADGQHEHCGMSVAARDEVYALLGEVAP
jgi:hypothetical protein